MTARIDRASRVIPADRATVFSALIDRKALERWLPPSGMSGRFEQFDARPGGSYRLVVSDDAAFSGTMTMTWELSREGDATRVDVRAENVPVGVSAEDHVTGMTSSLQNLADYLDSQGA